MGDLEQLKVSPSYSSHGGLELRIGALTDRGRVRERNEDRVLVFDLKRRRELSAVGTEIASLRPPGVLLVIADGMGGMSGGETASQMCVENLLTTFLNRLEAKPDGTRADPKQALGDAVRDTNDLIYARASADMRLRGMGTTLTGAFLQEDWMCVAQVGDSRAYLLRETELAQLTRDQTLVASLREQGKLPAGGLGKSWKNMLLQAVGAQPHVQVALTETPLYPGDMLLLCSDGLHGPVELEDLGNLLRGPRSPADKARALVERANENGGPDNVSVIVCEVAKEQRVGASGEQS